MQTVVNGVLVNYQIMGTAGRKNFTILHGWGRDLTEWIPITKILSEKYRVILIDLPGFGGSVIPQGTSLNMLEYTDILKALFGNLGVKKTILLGHSFGGKIGTLLASENKIVNKLILVDASGIRNESFKIKAIKALASVFGNSQNTIIERISKILSSPDYLQAGDLKQTFKNIVSFDTAVFAKKIKIPTLIIWGENDSEVPMTNGKKLNQLISNSIFRIVWGAGHNPHLENPDELTEILLEFI